MPTDEEKAQELWDIGVFKKMTGSKQCVDHEVFQPPQPKGETIMAPYQDYGPGTAVPSIHMAGLTGMGTIPQSEEPETMRHVHDVVQQAQDIAQLTRRIVRAMMPSTPQTEKAPVPPTPIRTGIHGALDEIRDMLCQIRDDVMTL